MDCVLTGGGLRPCSCQGCTHQVGVRTVLTASKNSNVPQPLLVWRMRGSGSKVLLVGAAAYSQYMHAVQPLMPAADMLRSVQYTCV